MRPHLERAGELGANTLRNPPGDEDERHAREHHRGSDTLQKVKHRRQADPYRDLDVIDARAPRLNQAVIGSLALVAFVTGWWALLALLGGQLVVGLTLGRRWCLPCLAYFELVQPLVGEGPIEDSPP